MEVSCYNCDNVTSLEVGFEVISFVCPHCKSVYEIDNQGQLRRRNQLNDYFEKTGLQIGQQGILEGKSYTVTGILVKLAAESYYWTEYILYDTQNQPIYLSEANGHWIKLREVEDQYEVDHHPKYLTYDGTGMDLYEYCNAEIFSAQGFFDFKIPTKKVHMVEYIAPPKIISIEKMNGKESTFYGEHLSKSVLQKAFPAARLPNRSGTGIVQPFMFNLRDTTIVFCIVTLLILISHGFIYSGQQEKEVFNKEMALDEFNNKEIVSPSFVLEGGSAPLSINVYSAVDNSWANLQVALINEKTGDEEYANKDVEQYHGYTDGESWSEGSTSEDFNICGVGAGAYHLVLTPLKAPADYSNNVMQIRVVWNQPSSRNIWMTVLGMVIILVILFSLNRNFEKNRWMDSDYSPYDYE